MKKSKLLLVSLILGAVYILYLGGYLIKISSDAASVQQSFEAIGTAIAVNLIMPHAVCVLIAVLFNGLGYFLNKKGFALTGAILYVVSIALMPLYFMFVIIQAILSFIGYAKMGSQKTTQ